MTKLSTRTLVRVGITTLALTLAACGGGGGSDGTEAAAPATAALSQAANCDDLLASIRADARAKIRAQANERRANGLPAEPPRSHGPHDPTPLPTLTPAPPRDATDTNTQVPGVDEADAVETDGDRLYLLRDSELLVLPAVPPEGTTIGERIPIEGFPLGMFVADGRALVASALRGTSALGGDPRCEPAFVFYPTPTYQDCTPTFVKLTLLDVTVTPSRVVREVYVEGDYVGARRHDMLARVIVQRFWGAHSVMRNFTVPFYDPPRSEADFRALVDEWEAATIATIDASTLDDWLPTIRERVDGALVEHPPDCTAVYTRQTGLEAMGTTAIVGLDLRSTDRSLDDTTLFGLASEIHASEDTLVLAYPERRETTSRTALHVFELPDGSSAVAYRGSGFVPGTILSQFSLDVRGDVVRVATRSTRELDGQPVTRVHTGRVEDGTLTIIGATDDIAPGESLRGVRFLGDHAYLVTFLQIDPLFVVDLADPRHPRVVGEVEIPGFSQYLHPLDADHLLTIGEDGLGAVALKLFDVGDPAAPRLVDGYELPPEFWSAAQWNHLAFTYDARLSCSRCPSPRTRFLRCPPSCDCSGSTRRPASPSRAPSGTAHPCPSRVRRPTSRSPAPRPSSWSAASSSATWSTRSAIWRSAPSGSTRPTRRSRSCDSTEPFIHGLRIRPPAALSTGGPWTRSHASSRAIAVGSRR
jgi:hypothetical protein